MQGVVGLHKWQYFKLKNIIHPSFVQHKRPRKFSLDELLLLTLIYMRQYVTQLFLSWIFDVSETTISRSIETVHEIMYDKLSSNIIIPPRAQRELNVSLFDGKIVSLIIDGAEQEVYKPSEKKVEQAVYSGKKCYHTITILVGVSPTGVVYALSPSYQGSIADSTMMLMAENRWFTNLDQDEFIMADKGFRGLEAHHNTLIPFIGKNLPHSKELFNRQIASVRIVVENAIRAIKEWKICSSCLRVHSSNLESALGFHNRNWVICAALTNLFRKIRVENSSL